MIFPYGEWVILSLALVTWAEKRASRRFFLFLTLAWVIGKCFEIIFASESPWHWHFARLLVMLFFGAWSWQRAKRRIVPLLFTSLILSFQTLFLVNEPGIFPYESLIFTSVQVFVAWLLAKSYWGTATAVVGSLLLNQALVRFSYEGIVRYADLPDPFVWNFGVGLFTVWAGLRTVADYYHEKEQQKTTAELLCSSGAQACENPDERELE